MRKLLLLVQLIFGVAVMLVAFVWGTLNTYQTISWFDSALRRHGAMIVADAMDSNIFRMALLLVGLGLVIDGWRRIRSAKHSHIPKAHNDAPSVSSAGFLSRKGGTMVVEDSLATGCEHGMVADGGELIARRSVVDGPRGRRTAKETYKTTLKDDDLRDRTARLLSALHDLAQRFDSLPNPAESEDRYLRECKELAGEFARTNHAEAVLIEQELEARLPIKTVPEDLEIAVSTSQAMLRTGKIAGAWPYRMIALHIDYMYKSVFGAA